MAHETEEIRRDIERKRHEIDDDITRLRGKLVDRMDWRWQVRHRPLTALGIGLVFGLFLGIITIR
jgi:ElaB/YqjD/DUF883 family membrane-anchored ribosome-binding protein